MGATADPRPRILYVEDDPTFLETVPRVLEQAGFEVITATRTDEAHELISRHGNPDFALLDLGLGVDDRGGELLATAIRERDGLIPIMMLSADATDLSNERCRKAGAWDFVVKDSDDGRGQRLVAKINSLLEIAQRIRQRNVQEPLKPVQIGGLTIDFDRYEAKLDGKVLPLSHKEFELLRRLVADAGKVVTRDTLMNDVWDENWFGSTKTLDVHIGWLRRKLGDDPADPKYLFTVRGVGFRFASAEEVDPN